MKKTYANLNELMTEIYQTIGVELAPDYDVYAIADALYTWEDGHMVADLERDDFWLIVAEHDLTEDWRETVELPEGTDQDVADVVNAGTYMVRNTFGCRLRDIDTVWEWFDRMCGADSSDTYAFYSEVSHMICRARVMTDEWRIKDSALDRERDMLEGWYNATTLCGYAHKDPCDSATFCKALTYFEHDPYDWFTLYFASLEL